MLESSEKLEIGKKKHSFILVKQLVDVPEMEYYAVDNQGEVCVKGSNVFNGYYKDPERTGEAIDENGWHHTGDIGMWLPNGALRIIDRRKHTFKLSQGEYIVPEKIESIYAKSQYICQNFVYGESLKVMLKFHFCIYCLKNKNHTIFEWLRLIVDNLYAALDET